MDADSMCGLPALLLAPAGGGALCHLARELEFRALGVDAVVVDAEDVGVARRLAHPELRREAEGGVLHRRLRAAALGAGKGLERKRVASDRERWGVSVREGHLSSLRAEIRAVEAGEHLEWATLLAAHDPVNRVELLVGCVVVDHHADRPVAGAQVRGKDVDEPDLGAAEVEVIEVSVGDVEDQVAVALAVRSSRWTIGGARTQQLARAGRQIRSRDTPGHWGAPFVGVAMEPKTAGPPRQDARSSALEPVRQRSA